MFSFGKKASAKTVHGRFEQQVALYPRAIALESDGVVLTYRELNQDANRMARRLVAARVEADGVVLLAMERSCELVVAMLAVLKAGGAFVLLDRALAGAQLEAFVKSTGAEVVVTDTARPFPVKRLRTVRYYAASGADQNLDQRTQADRWSCMTAGKVRSHDAVLLLLDSAREEVGFQSGDGMFSAMDLSGQAAMDLLLPLITGGRLVLATPQEMKDAGLLDAAIQAADCKFVRLPKAVPLSMAQPNTKAASASA